ncbi:MAG: hypothetical protein AAF517_20510 [Planctomycetota bacterium]
MASPSSSPSGATPDPRSIESTLSELRFLVRSSIVVRALAILVAVLAGIVFVSFGIDRLFRLSEPGRIVVNVIYVGTFLWAFWKFLIRPLRVQLPDLLLADILERHFPELADSLRSAVDFSNDGTLFDQEKIESLDSDHRITALMKRRVLALAVEKLGTVERDEVVDTPHLVETLLKGLAAASLLTAIFVAIPGSFPIWWQRNVLFADVEWPYKTRLAVQAEVNGDLLEFVDGQVGVPRGDPVKIVIRPSGDEPDRVEITLNFQSEELRYNVPKRGDSAFVHEHSAVTEEFQFEVSGGDYRSKPFRIVPLERPYVETLSVTLTPPEYTDRKPETFSGELGELAAPEGSTMSLKGTSNKSLARAWLSTEGKEIELRIDGANDKQFDGSYLPATGGGITVHLEDKEQVPPDRVLRYSLHLVPDRKPKVNLKVSGLGPMITPQALMPLEIDARDDYKVVKYELEWQVVDEERKETSGKVGLNPPDEPGPRVEDVRDWEVSSLNLVPEKRLNVRIGASDNDGLNGSKIGFSGTQSFLVVTTERLGEEFVRREEEQRRMLERILETEKTVRDRVYEMIDQEWSQAGALGNEVVKDMLGLTRIERQHSRQLEAVAKAVQQILTEMKNNRVGEADDLERLGQLIIGPLMRLAQESMPAATREIAKIRDAAEPAPRREKGLELAERLENHIATLESVIQQMRSLESFTEIVKFLRVIIKTQDDSIDAAKAELEKEVDDIFDDKDLFDDDEGDFPVGGEGQLAIAAGERDGDHGGDGDGGGFFDGGGASIMYHFQVHHVLINLGINAVEQASDVFAKVLHNGLEEGLDFPLPVFKKG